MSGCLNREWMSDPNVSDAEFWSRVYQQEGFGEEPEPEEPDDLERLGLLPSVPCPECSQTEACGYDDYGRPWIHSVKDYA